MKNILIIGLGNFGAHLALKFIEEGNAVLAVESNESRADSAASFIKNIQIGDATDERFISSLGVDNFDICVVALDDNFQSALEITVLLKDCGARFILARACRDVHRKLLLRNGADHVVFAEKEMAEKLAVKYGAKNIFDYIELTSEVAIYEIATPSSWYGKSIVEKSVRAKYNVSVLATKREGVIYPLPSANHIFTEGETLMVMGTPENVRAITK